MFIKTKKQGNSVMVTVPSEFNIGEGILVESELKENGIFYKFTSHSDNEMYFSTQLLKELVEEVKGLDEKGLQGVELIEEFQKIKALLPKRLSEIAGETKEHGKIISKDELMKELGQ